MQEDYGGYGRRKKPGIGRYPMGPTNIDSVDIGSCLWHPTFVVDICGGHRWWTSVEREYEDENGDSSQKM